MTLQTDEHLLRCAETPSVEPSRLVTTWRPLAGLEGLWHAAREVSGVPLRSVALRLADGRLAIYSPVRGLGHEAHLELTKIGPPVPVFVSAPVSDGSSGIHWCPSSCSDWPRRVYESTTILRSARMVSGARDVLLDGHGGEDVAGWCGGEPTFSLPAGLLEQSTCEVHAAVGVNALYLQFLE
jgi:hypothetical protein